METTTTDKPDFWSLTHDVVAGLPPAVLAVVDYITTALLITGLAILIVRMWKGDRFEFWLLKIERPDRVRDLEELLKDLSEDDKLKANVLWAFRERLNEAKYIITSGIEEPDVRGWCRGVLTDVITALSKGGHDRHRASLWVLGGDGLRMLNGMGFRQEAVDKATLPLNSIAGNVLKTGAKFNFADVTNEGSFAPKPRSGPSYRSLLAVPVRNPIGKTIAALCIDAEAQGYFDSDHEFFAECFADLIALLVAQVVPGDGL